MMYILILLTFLSNIQGQTYQQQAPTLLQLSKQQNPHDPLEQKAIEFVLKAHPELWNYTVIGISNQINRGNQTYADNLKDYLFELKGNDITILAMVTLSDLPKQQFVSVSPLITRDSQNGHLGDFYISRRIPPAPPSAIMNQTISSDRPKSYPKRPPLGGYLPFPNLQDPLLQFSLDYVASRHPNIVNYYLTEAEYQIVAGVNIKLEYEGLDDYSKVETVVSFDLSLKPEIRQFTVKCADQKDSECTPEVIWDIYCAIEGVILIHPELMQYRIVSLILQSVHPPRAMITFENRSQNLRSLTEIVVDSNKSTILSFFTYQYIPSSDI